MTSAAGDMIADMLLSGLVQRVEKSVELVFGLATEHGQQFLLPKERHHFAADRIPLFFANDLGSMKFIEKCRIFRIQIVHQEQVMLTDHVRMNISLIET